METFAGHGPGDDLVPQEGVGRPVEARVWPLRDPHHYVDAQERAHFRLRGLLPRGVGHLTWLRLLPDRVPVGPSDEPAKKGPR